MIRRAICKKMSVISITRDVSAHITLCKKKGRSMDHVKYAVRWVIRAKFLKRLAGKLVNNKQRCGVHKPEISTEIWNMRTPLTASLWILLAMKLNAQF